MDLDIWPLRELRATTPDVELRSPTHDDLGVLAALTTKEGFDPSVPWLAHQDDTPSERGRRLVQFVWNNWGILSPSRWAITLAAFVDERLVGVQTFYASDFGLTKEAGTGSWIVPDQRGKGIGTSMRAAVLHLGFEGLGARWMRSSARADNAASIAVTKKHGYDTDGLEQHVIGDQAYLAQRFRLDREVWQKSARPTVELAGIDECRALLGA